MSELNLDFYKNTNESKPRHGEQGQHRAFVGVWKGTNYTGDREGRDIYCAFCDYWNTVHGTGILFSVTGNCKVCGASFLKSNNK